LAKTARILTHFIFTVNVRNNYMMLSSRDQTGLESRDRNSGLGLRFSLEALSSASALASRFGIITDVAMEQLHC